jgi:hypothetical protein
MRPALGRLEQCKDLSSSSAGGAAADLKPWGGRWPDGAERSGAAGSQAVLCNCARTDGTRCSSLLVCAGARSRCSRRRLAAEKQGEEGRVVGEQQPAAAVGTGLLGGSKERRS